MAEQKIFLGSIGPLLYDDAVALDDIDFVGVDQAAIATQGQMYVGTAPTLPEHVARLDDIPDVSSFISNNALANWATAPYFYGSTGAGVNTYTTQVGRYVEVGLIVFFSAIIVVNTIGTGGDALTGLARIGGLPITSEATANQFGQATFSLWRYIDLSVGVTIGGHIGPGTTYIQIHESIDNGVGAYLPVSAIKNGSTVIVGGWYSST